MSQTAVALATREENLNPLLFISHKHDDQAIGKEVARFVRRISGGRVDIFLSSSANFEGPRVGKELGRELREALWRAGVLILIYTSEDKDWSWCMWECGLTQRPGGLATKVIVLQCLPDKPALFLNTVRALAWDEKSVIGFAERFLDKDFFPGFDGPVTGLRRRELVEAARELHRDLMAAIPQERPEDWSAWPFLRLSLTRRVIDAVRSAPVEERLGRACRALLTEATVVLSSGGSPQLFGRADLPCGLAFRELIEDWQESYPGRPTDWLEVIARQVVDGARKRYPQVDWERFRHVGSETESIAGLGRIKSDAATMQFDVYFLAVQEATDELKRRVSPEELAGFQPAASATIPKAVRRSTPPMKQRTRLFISYSHEDKDWLLKVKKHLAALESTGLSLDVWDDSKIRGGDKWKESINEAINSARVALLLVSTDFIASPFIKNNELPPLLSAAENEGATIVPLILKPCLFHRTQLDRFQAVNDPDREVLSEMKDHQVDRILMKLANRIADLLA